ncbi:MAG: hypothetical protein JWP88_755 [Flaviaesturariibacter sp.]|nr:hypothetical protein [Flaviaesturariibacter sp.]
MNFVRLPENKFLQRSFLKRNELDRLLFLGCSFSCAMVLFRVTYTGEWRFIFLVWNLFLATLPYVVSTQLQKRIDWIESNKRFMLATICWLLLLPNSFYILTDLFHLRASPVIPKWYDLAMLFSFAWNGLLLGTLSMRQMERIVSIKFSIKQEWLFVIPVTLLNALGIYIGRYLRYNSWDVLTNPAGLLAEIGQLLLHPVQNRFDWSMILCFSTLLFLFYSTLKSLGSRMT